ncbi:heme-thiolate peroxidase [Auricularia subglabra TFB-10046 SS5]|nr:heme-thiolate peroxidase [Auricularia subglabra TFB-10046 SS5]
MLLSNVALGLFAVGASALSIKPYESLAGRSDEEIEAFSHKFPTPGASPPPPAIKNLRQSLVFDKDHPYIAPRPGDARGPCPGMNTLANHGWLPRSGVATPQQIITASEKGFNMGHNLATFVTFANMLVNGNHLTNLMSIGTLTPLTGPAPPKPALAGGLSTHNTFEGDASMTRLDAHFGSNVDFNENLFQQFVNISNEFGGGIFNETAAAEVRYRRIVQSNETNPEFYFEVPRFPIAYAEAAFAIVFFVDGRKNDKNLDLKTARRFLEANKFPDGFHRRDGGFFIEDLDVVLNSLIGAHPVLPGSNVQNPDGTFHWVDKSETLTKYADTNCAVYEAFVNKTIAQYPNPKGALRKALNGNLKNIISPLNCTALKPYP